ncbi:MAG: hypothetical protein Q4B54_08920, partial [Coriobacteriales bacterium]|nr:hypothetical protein [Coriobacteriales bacterium]
MARVNLHTRVSKALSCSVLGVCGAAFALALGFGPIAPAPAYGQTLGTDSGVITIKKPTLRELTDLYAATTAHPTDATLWDLVPDVRAYTAGSHSAQAIEYAQARLNLVRAAANIDGVRLTSPLNDSAAQGALILARLNNGLTHYPETPSGVSDEQAEAGKTACISSNISCSWGLGSPLAVAIKGQIDDSDTGNMAMVGHRRWLLNPATSTLGIGSAKSADGALYTCVRVFGSDVQLTGSTDYDYVAWPPSGAFVSELFDTNVPWSVSLNKSRYAVPDAKSVVVTLTRLEDNKTWVLDSADNTPSENGEYLNVDFGGYGSGTCIVFRPNVAQVGERYEGTWSVNISGITTTGEVGITLQYEVQFGRATQEMYRLYNPNSGEHFYTRSASERNGLVSVGWRYEGVGWTAPSESDTPVFRLYNKNGGDHHYTTSAGECDALVGLGWTYEGIGWYSNDAQVTPVYRQY